jgi:acetyl-CoA carboxylase carboxyl transferase subunit alpha
MTYDLPFEKPLAELEIRIEKLKRKEERLSDQEWAQLQQLEQELQQKTREIYSNLTPWQTVLVARHQNRPHTVDYLKMLCADFTELHGDRLGADDTAIIGGPATLDGTSIMLIGQEKGRGIADQRLRHAGQPHPKGYRKAHRLLEQAEKFHLPVVCFIDTPGASIALEDEERGQASAIAHNLYLMSQLRVPTIGVILGEGGSGGALGIAVVDRLLMMEYSYYTVASPESAATIMWRDGKFAAQAAEAMQITAQQLKARGLIDDIIAEPPGGAHRQYQQAAELLKTSLLRRLQALRQLAPDELLEQRYRKLRAIGPYGFANVLPS